MPSSRGRSSIRITSFHIPTHTSATCQKRSKKVAVDDADDDDKRGGDGGGGAAQVKIKGFHLRHLVALAHQKATYDPNHKPP